MKTKLEDTSHKENRQQTILAKGMRILWLIITIIAKGIQINMEWNVLNRKAQVWVWKGFIPIIQQSSDLDDWGNLPGVKGGNDSSHNI